MKTMTLKQAIDHYNDLEGDAMMLSRAAREFVEFNKSLTIEVHE